MRLNSPMNETLINWAGNHTYRARRLRAPGTVEEIQELVARHRNLKALGARHSFNDIADSPGDLISLQNFNRVLSLDRERGAVTAEAGARYGDLCRYLHEAGYALHNLASLPHISVAGACATATHGSGDTNGSLATAVSALEMVIATGEIVSLSREKDGERFEGAIVALGGLGILTKLTLDILPAFEMRQDVYQNLSLKECEKRFDELTFSAYSVSLFTDWRGANFNQVWIKRRVTDGDSFKPPAELYGARLAARALHPIISLSAENCTEQMGIHGPWHERLPHFRMDFTPSSGEELQSEYILPRQHALDAFHAIDKIHEQVNPLLQISEIRTIAADRLWMSPCYRRDCVAVHFTWQKDWEAVKRLLPIIEERLAPFEARPHWGKLFTTPPARLKSLYPKLGDFQQLLRHYDPEGKFRNDFLNTYIFGEA